MRANNLASFLSILLDKHDVTPRRCAKLAGVVVGISRPYESVFWHMIPFLARHLASFAPDANGWIGKETDLNIVTHIRVATLIGAMCAFADHIIREFQVPACAQR